MTRPVRRTNRYPLAPLMARMGVTVGRHGGQQPDQDPEGIAAIALALGVTTRRVRFMLEDGLDERCADRFAIAAGFHPQQVWPTWSDTAPGEEDLHDKRCRGSVADRRPIGAECDRCGRSLPAATSSRRVA